MKPTIIYAILIGLIVVMIFLLRYRRNCRCNSLSKPFTATNVVILNAPCNGFGDLIFALKLSNYIKEWYGANITIATPLEKGLLSLGANPNNVIGLTNLDGTTKRLQCRLFSRLKMKQTLPKQDLIFIGPMMADYFPDLHDVKKLVPYATIVNTFFFSEYNDEMDKGFDFNTGVGQKRDGILLTNPQVDKEHLPNLANPYTVVYVAKIDGVDNCVSRFMEMVASKYSTRKKILDVVIPNWMTKIKASLVNKLKKYYQKIVLTLPTKTITLYNREGEKEKEKVKGKVLTFRADILPVSNTVMLQLMKHSIKDILLTGDQSISDALSCCPDKNIFYQIAHWKQDFGYQMGRLLPNKYYKSPKTACGIVKAKKYKSNYKQFVKKYSFKKIGKPKLDAIILSAIAIKTDKNIKHIAEIVSTGTLHQVKSSLENSLHSKKSE